MTAVHLKFLCFFFSPQGYIAIYGVLIHNTKSIHVIVIPRSKDLGSMPDHLKVKEAFNMRQKLTPHCKVKFAPSMFL